MSLYFDENLALDVSKRARKKSLSVSKYVSDILRANMDDEWTEEFLSSLGSVGADSIERPTQPDFALDSHREKM
jgi:hypothetical protein